MASSIKDRLNAIDIVKNYVGNNPYILMLKKDILKQDISVLNDFAIEYINSNYNFQPKQINKVIKIADWYGEKKQEDWGLNFKPEKVSVKVLLGETSTTYHCYVKFRQNMEPKQVFLPKKAVLTNFLIEDYNKIQVDFDRYDRLSMAKDSERKMKQHQKDAVKFLLSRKKCILADDMGLGKSLSLSVAAIEGNFDSVIIICPASLKTNWRDELLWYVPERDITIVDSYQGKTKSELEKMLGYAEGRSGLKLSELQEQFKERGKWQDNRFVIVNFDVLDEFYQIPATRSKENIEKAFQNSPMLQYIKDKKSLIVIDEAHKLSKSTSIRYKIIKDLIKRGQPHNIYAATGTPITNNPQNLYCVLQLLGDSITDDYNYYMERYCDAKKFPKNAEEKAKRNAITERFIKAKGKNTWYDLNDEEKMELNKIVEKSVKMNIVANGASNLDELKERISHMYLRRTKEDFNDLPEKRIHEVFYDLSYTQKCEYDKLWEEYEQQKLEENPDSELNKELIEGGIYRRYLSNQMVPNTIALTEEFVANGDKVVIACCYDDELYTLQEYFGESCVIYNGKMSLKEKDKAVHDFKTNPDVNIFIGNITAAGVGITLIVSNKLIFNNLSYVSGDNQQMQDRIYRIGQTKDCDIYYQMFKDTQYEKMWNIVLRKQLIIDQVIKKEDEK
jgi:SWI/SNF-related matrix-associated actin-dependent regulator 1 of chromatin subfamily A